MKKLRAEKAEPSDGAMVVVVLRYVGLMMNLLVCALGRNDMLEVYCLRGSFGEA